MLKAIDTPTPPQTDWIFFSSPSGVALFAQQYGLLANTKLAALGNGTAQAIKAHFSQRPNHTSFASQPEEAIAEFASQVLPNETVLVPRSEQSLKRLAGILTERMHVDWPFYRTIQSPPEEASVATYLIFTSPSNAGAYFSHHKVRAAQICVGIGKSTADKLRDLGIRKVLESKTPTEVALWEVISQNWKIT